MPLIRFVAQLLGWIMSGVYWVLDKIHIPNIGLSILFFTVIIYILMWPLQVKQQKSSKIMAALQPELKKIQKKYAGRRDQASQAKMQEETLALYRQYGTSPTGSCGTLLIQMPLLFGLYQVIYHIPGYVAKVRDIFDGLATKIMAIPSSSGVITKFISEKGVRVMGLGEKLSKENVIDFLYALKPGQWAQLKEIGTFTNAGLAEQMTQVQETSTKINSFLGINIAESPWDVITGVKANLTNGSTAKVLVILSLVVAVMIPVLAWFTQWLNYKLMPQSAAQESGAMRSMNLIMPIFSAFICITFSMGIGIYWIIGAVVRCVQQVIINRRIGKLDPEDLRKAAAEKQQKKLEKQKDYERNITKQAQFGAQERRNRKTEADNNVDTEQIYEAMKDAAPTSITAKANLVRAYEERTGDRPGGKKNKGNKKR